MMTVSAVCRFKPRPPARVDKIKMKYSILTGSFGYDGINEFLRDLSYGKGRTNPIRGAKIPKISKVS